jgi:Mg-chelatase subunit ChlD
MTVSAGGWIRRVYDAAGVTQYPPGPGLAAMRARTQGHVLLCVDVSGSMSFDADGRTRLVAAVAGAKGFAAQARSAGYQVGLVLWHHEVHAHVPVGADDVEITRALDRAFASGGNDIVPTLQLGIEELGPLVGDRVIAIFGDGDLGPARPAAAAAKKVARKGIRILVRGLGADAAEELRRIATEDDGETVIGDAAEIESGIISMARGIAARRKR